MKLKKALELVTELAEHNTLTPRDCHTDMALLREMRRQKEALRTLKRAGGLLMDAPKGRVGAARRMEARDSWGEHPEYKRATWRLRVYDGDTNLGYWDWVCHQIETSPESDGNKN